MVNSYIVCWGTGKDFLNKYLFILDRLSTYYPISSWEDVFVTNQFYYTVIVSNSRNDIVGICISKSVNIKYTIVEMSASGKKATQIARDMLSNIEYYFAQYLKDDLD